MERSVHPTDESPVIVWCEYKDYRDMAVYTIGVQDGKQVIAVDGSDLAPFDALQSDDDTIFDLESAIDRYITRIVNGLTEDPRD